MLSISSYDAKLAKAHWSSFKLYNGYRVLIALTLLLGHNIDLNWQTINDDIFAKTALGYLVFSIISVTVTWFEKPKLELTLPFQIILDILFILLLMQADASNHNMMSMLLVISIAAASLVSDGRLSLFYAAVATIGILLQQFLDSLIHPNISHDFTSAVVLSIACFAIAWLAHSLATRMQHSEQLASQRGLDLKSLAQVNALITHRMKDGVIVVDHNLFIKHHNLQADAFLNLDNKDWEEKSLDLIAPEIATLLTKWFDDEQVLSDNTSSIISTVNIFSRELRISFLPVAENRNQGAVVFIEDWSQVQTQSHQVKLAALGRLTAKIAHEIRNPLSSISHANQLLQEEENMPAANQRMLQIIEDNVGRVDQIIKDVLELNRRDRTNQETIHLNQFISEFHQEFCAVENISTDYFTLTTERNTEVNKDVILFDRRHLNQILWNLCKNGWRHSMQQKNSLNVRVYTNGQSLVTNVEITDDGEGIPDNIHTHLFEPFFTTEKSGTGLGLYISRELAGANGANLQYKQSVIGAKFVIQIKKATI
jgi:two-component system, NtrC family, sensor histidine kinase PilS